MREEVEDLLRRDETGHGLLDHPASDHFDALFAAAVQAEGSPADLTGKQVGPFQILGGSARAAWASSSRRANRIRRARWP